MLSRSSTSTYLWPLVATRYVKLVDSLLSSSAVSSALLDTLTCFIPSQVKYANVPFKAREILLEAVQKYRGDDNCDFIKKRFEYFDEFDKGSMTAPFQLAMLWASVGNTMPATFWLMFFLLSNPKSLQKLMVEIKQVCMYEIICLSFDFFICCFDACGRIIISVGPFLNVDSFLCGTL